MPSEFIAREPQYLGLLDQGAWTLKYYEMSATGDPIGPALRASARDQLRREFTAQADAEEPGAEQPGASADSPQGVGFAVLHHGDEAVWLLCDLWHADILHHRLWRADLADPGAFEPVASPGPVACVHELVVIAHEREAYVKHVLDSPEPSHEAYLRDVHLPPEAARRQALLQFDRAWRSGDVDALMALMVEEPCYGASLGLFPGGEEHRGAESVRRAFRDVIAAERDAAAGGVDPEGPLDAMDVWLVGDRALTRWSYTATGPSGDTGRVHGVDLWEFDGERIKSKDAYRKASAPLVDVPTAPSVSWRRPAAARRQAPRARPER